jgi:hypothetical protein
VSESSTPKIYDRGTGARRPPPGDIGLGCVYNALALALPVLVLLATIGVFAAVWLVAGDRHRAGLGAAGIALYGMLVVIPLYIPYVAGFTAVRAAARARGTGRVARYMLYLLVLALPLGGLALALGHIAVLALLLVLVVVPSIAGLASLGARALGERERVLLYGAE